MSMHRIEQALERARGETLRPAASSAGPAFAYTETRVLTPDPGALERARVLTSRAGDLATSAYKLLRTQVLRGMRRNGWTTLGITSPGSAEGKTLTSVNLAISLAREVNHSVALVDLDLRRPGVHRCFGIEPQAGIADHLLDNVPLADVLFNPGIERLVVAPGRESIASSSELLSSPAMVSCVQEMKTRYASRLLLFDLPPLLAADDVLAFSPCLDAVLLVVEDARTPRDELAQSARLLQGTPLLGCVLNRASESLTTNY